MHGEIIVNKMVLGVLVTAVCPRRRRVRIIRGQHTPLAPELADAVFVPGWLLTKTDPLNTQLLAELVKMGEL